MPLKELKAFMHISADDVNEELCSPKFDPKTLKQMNDYTAGERMLLQK